MMDYPVIFFAASLLVLWSSEQAGGYLHRRQKDLEEAAQKDLDVILTATLTLLVLIIGFTFSMAVNRYDQRKNYEEAEANAIGTEYFRAGLLPASEASKVRELLMSYVRQRVLFYTTRNKHELDQVNASTARLQSDLWSVIQPRAEAQPTPVMAVVVAGMNDVLNSQGYTQAAWWNRIPAAAWALMGAIAICGTLLLGFTSRRYDGNTTRSWILPLIVSISFFLIADLDAPRAGVIRVRPQNLMTLYSLGAP
jgi:hypothetical protein